MKFRNIKIIDVQDWDDLVRETYNKPYSFQQQDGCKGRGIVYFDVPESEYDYSNDSIVEKVNGPEEGVSFKAWLARDPKEPLKDKKESSKWDLDLFWDRNFYPHVSMIINDMHKKGLIEKGEFSIEIDW